MGIYSLQDLRDQAPEELKDASDAQLLVEYSQQSGMNPQDVAELLGYSTGRDSGDFSAGVASGVDVVQMLGTSALAGTADLVGADSIAGSLRGSADRQGYESYLAGKPGLDRVEDLESIGDYIDYAQYQIGKQVPIMATVMGAQALPGLGQAGTAAGLTRLATLAPRALGGGGLKAGASREARRQALAQGKALTKSTMVGSGLGFGSLYKSSGADGEYDPLTSLALSPLYGLAEAAVPAALTGVARIKTGGYTGGRVARFGKGGAVGSVGEAGTETFQTALELGVDGTATAEEARSQFLNAAVAGGLTGGSMSGAASSLLQRRVEAPNKIETNELNETDLAPAAVVQEPSVPTDTTSVVGGDLFTRRAEEEAKVAAEAENTDYYYGDGAAGTFAAELLADVYEGTAITAKQRMAQERRYITQTRRLDLTNSEILKLEEELSEVETNSPGSRQLTVGQRITKERRLSVLEATRDLQEAEFEEINSYLNSSSISTEANTKLKTLRGALDKIGEQDAEGYTSPILLQPLDEAETAILQEADPALFAELNIEERQQEETDLTVSNDPESEAQDDLFDGAPVVEITAPSVTQVEQTQEELESEVLAAEFLESEETSQAIDGAVNKALKSEVDATTNEATGNITLADGVHKAIAIMLRHPAFNPAPIVANKGISAVSPDYINKEATATNSEKIKRIHKNLLDIVKYASIVNNQAGNLDRRTTTTVKGVTTTNKQRQPAGSDTQAVYNKAVQDLTNSFDELMNVSAGGISPRDLSAITAGLKIRKEGTQQARLNEDSYKLKTSNIFPAGYQFTSGNEVNTTIDTLISSAFSQYKDGTLGQRDIVSGRASRKNRAEQAAGQASPIEEAIAEAKKGKKNVLSAIVEKMSSWKGTSSPYAVSLGRSIRDSLERMDKENWNPNVQIIGENNDKTGPQYDPATNTVYISRDATQVEVLHEVLHATLQGFVYSEFRKDANERDARVVDLETSLNNILDFESNGGVESVNMPEIHKQKAKYVLGVLRKLKEEGKTEDAILELISYGTTLRDFRQLLTEIDPSHTAATEPWYSSLTATIKSIMRLVQGFLTGRVDDNQKGESERIVLNTFALLEKTTSDTAFNPPEGTSSLFSSDFNDVAALDSSGKPVGDLFNSPEAKNSLFDSFTSRFIFGNWPERAEKIAAWRDANIEKMNANNPKLAGHLSKWAAHFQLPVAMTTYFKGYKEQRNTIYMNLTRLVESIERSDIKKSSAIFAYLDGDKTALDGLEGSAKIKLEADIINETMQGMITQLPAYIQKDFKGKSFTESLIFVDDKSTVSSHAMTMTALTNQMKKQGIEYQVDLVENKSLLMLDSNGDVVLDGETFYKATVKPNNGTPTYSTMVSKTKFEQSGGQLLSAGNQVSVSVADGEFSMAKFAGKAKTYRFLRDNNYKESLDERKVTSIINAMRNTIGGIASFFATQNFYTAMSIQGKESNQVFDRVEDILEAYPEFANKIGFGEGRKAPATVEEAIELGNKVRVRGQFVQFPDNPEQYGDMAGKIMHGPVFAAMHDMSDRNPVTSMEGYNASLRTWKKMKTIYNPGTHVTNVASNVSLLIMHDIPISTLFKATNLMARYESGKGKPLTPSELSIMKVFMTSGAMLGNYSSVEVKRELAQSAKDNLVLEGNETVMSRVTAMINFEAEKGNIAARVARKIGSKLESADSISTQLYAAEDNAFRLASFIKHVGDSKSLSTDGIVTSEMLQAAGRRARQDFLDYDIDSQAVKLARQTYLPFVSWTYAITPVLGRIALHQPWKIVNLLAGYAMIDMAASALAGDDEEARKRGPAKLDEKVFGIPLMNTYIRLPFGDDDNPVYYKLGDYIPLASSVRGLPTNNGFMGQDWWPQGLQPGGPFLTAIIASLGGVDAFTGEKLHKTTDTDIQKALNVGEQILNAATPPWARTSNVKKIIDITEGNVNFAGREQDVARLIIANILGLKVDGYNIDQEMLSRQFKNSQLVRDFSAAMNSIKREEMRSGNPDYQGMDEAMKELQVKLYEEINELYKTEKQ